MDSVEIVHVLEYSTKHKQNVYGPGQLGCGSWTHWHSGGPGATPEDPKQQLYVPAPCIPHADVMLPSEFRRQNICYCSSLLVNITHSSHVLSFMHAETCAPGVGGFQSRLSSDSYGSISFGAESGSLC